MTEATNEILNTCDLAEEQYDGEGSEEVRSDLVATHEAEGRGIEFHVSMRDYTFRDMEELIVAAAAQQIIGRRNDRELAKAIEAKCIELVAEKADRALASVTAEIIEQPLVPNFGDKKPVTMREFLGLYGREYLTERVGNDGKPGGSDGWSRSTTTRMEWLVRQYMDRKFADEIKAATSAAIREIQTAVKAEHDALVAAEKARLREALTKASA